MHGLLFTFEGPDGAGKTTQVRRLEQALTAAGEPARACYEPGTTALGNQIRSLVKQPGTVICPEAELFLFQAARAQMVREIVIPLLREGTHVILDRFIGSTWVYQGWVRGVNLLTVEFCNRLAAAGVSVARTWLLDVPVAESERRRQVRSGQADRFDQQDSVFHGKVREGYLALAQTYPEQILTLDGQQDQEALHQTILHDALHKIRSRSGIPRIPSDLPMAVAA